MGIFNKDKRSTGQPVRVANIVDSNINTASITNGNAFVDGEVLRKMPFAQNEIIKLSESWKDDSVDSVETPNLFASWSDIYDGWMGTYIMTEGTDGIKDHQNLILHYIFLYERFAMYRVEDDNWLVGNYAVKTSDNYGNMLKGTFIPWNYATLKPVEELNHIEINNKNKDNFINHQMSPYGIPTFLKIGFYVKVRKILWMFKKTNLRLSILQKVIGLEAEGKEHMIKFLNELFNQNDDFISPIQVVDITTNNKQGTDKKYSINFTDLSKDNQIDLSFDYRGVEISDDISGVTQEIFRIAGIRTDLQNNTHSYDERNTTSQVQQASNYFDTRENFVLKEFERFSRNFKKKFGIDVKWESIYKIQGENQWEEKQGEDPEIQ